MRAYQAARGKLPDPDTAKAQVRKADAPITTVGPTLSEPAANVQLARANEKSWSQKPTGEPGHNSGTSAEPVATSTTVQALPKFSAIFPVAADQGSSLSPIKESSANITRVSNDSTNPELAKLVPVFLKGDSAGDEPGSTHSVADSRGETNSRERFEEWLHQTSDVSDVNKLKIDILGNFPSHQRTAMVGQHRPIQDAFKGTGTYLAALQYYYAPANDPTGNNLSVFARAKGMRPPTLARWISNDKEWKVGRATGHDKVAQQLFAVRPDLLPGFSPVIVFSNLPQSVGEVPNSALKRRKVFNEAVAQARNVFNQKEILRFTGAKAPNEPTIRFERMHQPIADALAGKGLYLGAMRYYNLSDEQRAKQTFLKFCSDQCALPASMSHWISSDGNWTRGTKAGHINVMTQLAARRPDLLTLSEHVIASAVNIKRPGLDVGTPGGNLGAQATHAESIIPAVHPSTPVAELGAAPTGDPAVNQPTDDTYIDISSPPLISLGLESDDSSSNLIIDTAPSSTAASSVQSPEVIEMEAQPSYFRPWIKPEPASSPPPAPEFDNPILAEAPVKKEVPILRHRIDNTVPILQGDNGEDILLAALQTSYKNKQSSDLQELLDRMKLTFGASTKEAIVKTAEQAAGTNVRAKIKNIKDDVGDRARWLATLSGEERARYMESWMEVEEVPGMGRGVKAVRDIPPFTVLAPYAGKLLSGDAINAEWEKLGMNFTNYTFGTKSANTLISAFGDGIGNISSLVNKADDPTQNNVTVMLLGGKLVYLMNDRPISAGEALLYDYGEAYDYSGWPKHPILVQDSEPSDASGTESEIE